ncbi:MAG: hypothetical protein U5L98_09095 [Halomonas sp.]|nr:hypothetical protein [Halomonas sp.]MDZ7852780.1 hypothetical protein [Halomonas sp.]
MALASKALMPPSAFLGFCSHWLAFSRLPKTSSASRMSLLARVPAIAFFSRERLASRAAMAQGPGLDDAQARDINPMLRQPIERRQWHALADQLIGPGAMMPTHEPGDGVFHIDIERFHGLILQI